MEAERQVVVEYELHVGDCLGVMAGMDENSIDAIVTDPPYGLQFMGKEWDHGVPGEAFWIEALRVAKPGAWMLAFGGTRTWHRLAVAIEDAGWEIRDTIAWVYGQGFPKSHNVSKAIDKMMGAEREVVAGKWNGRGKGIDGNTFKHNTGSVERTDSLPATPQAKQWDGWGTALKPSFEPVVVARKPLIGTVAANVLEWGTGAINIDGCRVGMSEHDMEIIRSAGGFMNAGWTGMPTGRYNARTEEHYMPSTGAKPHESGRWPANFIHDGSDEVLALMPETKAGVAVRVNRASKYNNSSYSIAGPLENMSYADSGSAARFFYCAKASKRDRDEGLDDMTNTHATVKPTDLMRYLCRLVTPPGGTVLDPFMGSGSTGKAAMFEGFNFVGIELDADNVEIARRRIEYARKQPRLV